MIRWFITHSWKSALRSGVWQKNLLTNIVIGFFALILILYMLILGIFIDKILEELAPDRNPLNVFGSVMFYYFLTDLLMRYMFQSLSTLAVEPYLHLPIRRSTLVHYVTAKSFLHLFNFIPLLVFVPFILKVVVPEQGAIVGISYGLSLLLLVFNNNFLATYFKRQLTGQARIAAIAGGSVLLLITLDYFKLISLSTVSEWTFMKFIAYPVLVVLPLALLFFSYMLNVRYLQKNAYLEEMPETRGKGATETLSDIRYLSKLGLTGSFIGLELKLWLRNKRTKSILYMFPIFVLYGLFFYPNPVYNDKPGFLIFVGIFISGGMMLNYLNYAFGYESTYFDYLLTSRIDLKQYLRVKLIVAMLISTFCFIVTIPYVLFGVDILYINIATYLFNIGFLSFLLLFMATYNKKRMDLSKGAAFNYQGVGAANWLAVLPAFLLPVIMYLVFNFLLNKYAALMIIGLTGIAGLVFTPFFVKVIQEQLLEKRYVMAENFRKES
ncbi:MAG: DUF5687 family protein [Bacteroidales bacterium]|nr:DUF5687 family protein [Bacteroidales bacterium]